MRRDVTFQTLDQVALAGWLYLPENRETSVPGIVLSHGFGAVKEMALDTYAQAFCDAGFACLVYDHRNTGASGGTVRGELNPWEQIADTRDAITYLAGRPEVDPDRIGLWGTSYAGGHAIVVAAIDRRVRCVVALVPTISGYENTVRSLPTDSSIPANDIDEFVALMAEERRLRTQGASPRYIPISTEGSESFNWSKVAGKGTSYVNAVTMLSRDLRMGYEPGDYLPRVSPTPLLMVIAKEDTKCMSDIQLAAYSLAHEPKRLVIIPGGHYDPYTIEINRSSSAARDWFLEHLAEA